MDDDKTNKVKMAAQAVSTAVMVLRMEEPTIKAFLKECRDMEDFGHITNPTLYRDPTRRAMSELMQPLFEAAEHFIRVYDAHIVKAKDAVQKVGAA